MNKTAFLTTIFPVNNEYVTDFFSSLQNQSDSNFDVLVLVDGYSGFEKIQSEYCDLNIIPVSPSGGIAKNREKLIKTAISTGYEILIFGDIDDFFSKNRVLQSKKLLDKCDVVVNDLSLINNGVLIKKNILSSRVNDLDVVSSDYILNKNVFGLSNTAINVGDLSVEDIDFNENLIAVDWYFYSYLLNRGKKALFTDQMITFYRQHDSNTVGIGSISEASMIQSINVRLQHYKFMSKVWPKYERLYKSAQQCALLIERRDKLLELVILNQQQLKNPFWWEVVEK